MFRLFDFRCEHCGNETEDLVSCHMEGDDLIIEDLPRCECGFQMCRDFRTMNFAFDPKYHSNMLHRKKVELTYEDADGKKHVHDLTHKIDYSQYKETMNKTGD